MKHGLSFIEIKFPNGYKHKYDMNDTYENKLKIVDEIISSWNSYFNQNWDKTLIIGGSPIKPVPKILDSLGYYLLYKTEKELTKEGIQNRYKTNSAHREIPASCCASNIQDLFYSINEDEYTVDNSVYGNTNEYGSVDRKYKQFRHLRKIDPQFIEHIRIDKSSEDIIKIAKVDTDLYLCVSQKFYQEKYAGQVAKELTWHYRKLKKNLGFRDDSLKDKNKLLHFAKKSYMNTLIQFEKIDLFRNNNLTPSLPCFYTWAIVDNNKEFKVNNETYKINTDYEYDRILYYKQNEKEYFLTPKIDLITEFIREI